MVLQSDYPPDIRVSKEMKALTAANNELFLLCNNKSGFARTENLDGATIIRLNSHASLPAKLRSLINVPLFFNPVWLHQMAKAIRTYHIDVIHIHDLPLMLSGIILGKFYRLPAIFDVHENYPAALKLWWKNSLSHFLFRNPQFAKVLENICVRFADKIIVVAPEHKNTFIKVNVDPARIHVVENTVENDSYTHIRIHQEIVQLYKSFFTLGYVGKFGTERSLDTAIVGVKLLRQHIANLKLILVGDGVNTSQLKELAAKEGVGNLVDFIGWVDFELTPSYIDACDVCIVPQSANELIDNGVPHKLFQYMALGKPVVVSDSKALARIVSESRCGEIFQSNSSQAFADAVLRIYHSSMNYGENGRNAILTLYNWEKSSEELLKLYNQL